MTDNTSEQQLASEAKTALLIAVKEAANKGLGERALQLAQAYAAISEVKRKPELPAPSGYVDQRLDNRR
ncbi:hypothetical protein [Streptomyces sp. NPDC057854]|uniref:hypothetical protein n=1 Tax=unclassified Streptomyces TaxID=2593676 RepID=UPI0036849AF8